MTSRPMPSRAFQEVHADFCEFRGVQFLVVVDGYSGYPALFHFGDNASAHKLVNQMRLLFCQTAVPETIWTDGGPQFTSAVFQSFLRRWGVRHNTSSPYYTASNGRAEAAVKQIKKILSGCVRNDKTFDADQIVEAILIYKNTPLYDGRIPSVLVFGNPILLIDVTLTRSGRKQLTRSKQKPQESMNEWNKLTISQRGSYLLCGMACMLPFSTPLQKSGVDMGRLWGQ